jgi:hypothetical protein
MRPNLAVLTLLAVGIIAAAANAAPDKVVATFQDNDLGAGIVTGDVTLDPIPSRGEVMIHASLRGLEPSTSYTIVVYDQSDACADGTTTIAIIEFESNPAGNANLNRKVAAQLDQIESLGVRVQSTNELAACANVPEQQ